MLTSWPSLQLNTLGNVVCRLSALVVLPAMLLAVVVPNVSGMVSQTCEESQLPAESEAREEVREEAFVSSERRFRLSPAPIAWANDWCITHQPSRTHSQQLLLSTVGHRLSYDLLAPMTC